MKKSFIKTVALLASSVAISTFAQEEASNETSSGPSLLVSPEQRTFEGRLAPHDSIYFIYGADDPAAKFQFSFKYRLLDALEGTGGAKRDTFLSFGYTQRSLWDTEADSSPFYDTSYMPEIILESSRWAPDKYGAFTWFGQQLGLKHESNGRDGVSSRSLNTLYFRPVFSVGPADGWHALFAPQVYAFVTELDNNPELPVYRGYGELRGVIRKGEGLALGYMVRSGKDFDNLTYQLDLTVPVEIKILDLALYLQVQYFNGYGESLLSYKKESDLVRVGFSLVR